jgi:hypothetical protein
MSTEINDNVSISMNLKFVESNNFLKINLKYEKYNL